MCNDELNRPIVYTIEERQHTYFKEDGQKAVYDNGQLQGCLTGREATLLNTNGLTITLNIDATAGPAFDGWFIQWIQITVLANTYICLFNDWLQPPDPRSGSPNIQTISCDVMEYYRYWMNPDQPWKTPESSG